MPLNDLTLKQGATYAPTGGTDVAFSTATVINPVPGMIQVANYGNLTYRNMEHITFLDRAPKLTNGQFSKAIRKATVYIPRDYDEKYVKNLIRIQAEVHPAMTDADKDLLLDLAIQLLINEGRDFFKTGKSS